jgi:serine/threonine protein kinase/formylglycine-generating enzyme required for sulfatase activity/tetratricopeptide (TPR) repeat protein
MESLFNTQASALCGGTKAYQAFALLWENGNFPDFHDFLRENPQLTPKEIVEVLSVDQWQRWSRGELIRAENYLTSFPQVHDDAELAVELIYGEFLARERLGESPAFEEFAGRFPQFADRLQLQVELHQAMNAIQESQVGSISESWIDMKESGKVDGTNDSFLVTDPLSSSTSITHRNSKTSLCPTYPEVKGYQIQAELGRGAMGIVYRAWQTSLKRTVAIKVLRSGADDPEHLTRFRIEAEAAAQLRHPNIVQIYEGGETTGRPYLAMEYVEGGTLARYMSGKPQPPQNAAQIVKSLARTIQFAHERGIIHRDLKPGNILLQKSDTPSLKSEKEENGTSSDFEFRISDFIPKISDFGLAKRLDDDTGQTQTGMILGTPSYMAPEQAAGKKKTISPAVDVYALGAILYELLTGRPPFLADTIPSTLHQVQFQEPLSPRRLQPNLARDLDTICLKCLEKKPNRRYANALALAEDLGRFLSNRPILARPTPAWERGLKWAKRRPAWATLWTVSAAAITILFISGIWFTLKLQTEINHVQEAEGKTLAGSIEALMTAAPDSVPFILETLKPRREEVLTKLTERLRGIEGTLLERIRLNVTLSALGENRTSELCGLVCQTPASESFNLILGLKCGDWPETIEILSALYLKSKADLERFRLAVALLELGDAEAAKVELALKPNPSARVQFIHLFPNWHGDLSQVLALMHSEHDPAFHSGLCLALGSLDSARIPSSTQAELDMILTELYVAAPDGGTHSAAEWALFHRSTSLPPIPRTQGPVEGRKWFINRQGMTLVAIEPGLFHPRDYEYSSAWFAPIHTVVLTRPFFMADQTVTEEMYLRFLGSNDHPEGEKLTAADRPPSADDTQSRLDWNHPLLTKELANVHRHSAILFCNWLSRAEGRTPCYQPYPPEKGGWTCDFGSNGYRLATDAEWEYVHRHGTTTRFAVGDDVGRMADYGRVFATGVGPGKKFFPNPWGVFDLQGNWWQMCWDTGYLETTSGLAINPVGPVGSIHTIRGGSFDAGTFHLHGSLRMNGTVDGGALIRVVCGPLEQMAKSNEKAVSLKILTQSLAQFGKSRPQLWRARGRLYADMGDFDKSAADYARALELAPNSTAIKLDIMGCDEVLTRVAQTPMPGSASWWLLRADWLARRGGWAEAAQASATSIELDPSGGTNWFFDSLLRLWSGDQEAYRRDCNRMLELYKDDKSHYILDYTAKTCLTFPNAVSDLNPVLKLARRSLVGLENYPGYRWFLTCKALAEYRAGRFDETLEVIKQINPTSNGGSLDATAFVIVAMAEHHRSHVQQAKQAQAQCVSLLNRNWPRFERGEHFDSDWVNWLRCELLRREADILLNGAVIESKK